MKTTDMCHCVMIANSSAFELYCSKMLLTIMCNKAPDWHRGVLDRGRGVMNFHVGRGGGGQH